MKDSLQIREATIADVAAITEVHLDAWKSAYRHIFSAEALESLDFDDRKRRWEEVLTVAGSTTLLAESKGEILGFINFGSVREDERPLKNRPVGEIMAIYVSPHRWDQGVGYRLAVSALDQLEKAGMAEVVLWVLAENDRAIRFYERVGFISHDATKETEVLGRKVFVRQFAFPL